MVLYLIQHLSVLFVLILQVQLKILLLIDVQDLILNLSVLLTIKARIGCFFSIQRNQTNQFFVDWF
jgi:hypothetical protein